MDDRPISSIRLITITLWVLVILLLAAAWILCVGLGWHGALLLGFTACSLSAFAAVMHLRCVVNRAVRYVLANINSEPDGLRGL